MDPELVARGIRFGAEQCVMLLDRSTTDPTEARELEATIRIPGQAGLIVVLARVLPDPEVQGV